MEKSVSMLTEARDRVAAGNVSFGSQVERLASLEATIDQHTRTLREAPEILRQQTEGLDALRSFYEERYG